MKKMDSVSGSVHSSEQYLNKSIGYLVSTAPTVNWINDSVTQKNLATTKSVTYSHSDDTTLKKKQARILLKHSNQC